MASVGVGSPGTRADGYRSAAVTGGCEQLAGSQEIQKGEGNLRHKGHIISAGNTQNIIISKLPGKFNGWHCCANVLIIILQLETSLGC